MSTQDSGGESSRVRWGQSLPVSKLTRVALVSAGSLSRLSFAEDISAEGDDQTLNRGKHKKKGNKLLEKSDPEEEGGELHSLPWMRDGVEDAGSPRGAACAPAALAGWAGSP